MRQRMEDSQEYVINTERMKRAEYWKVSEQCIEDWVQMVKKRLYKGLIVQTALCGTEGINGYKRAGV